MLAVVESHINMIVTLILLAAVPSVRASSSLSSGLYIYIYIEREREIDRERERYCMCIYIYDIYIYIYMCFHSTLSPTLCT